MGTLGEILLCGSMHQSLKGASWVESYFLVQCVRHWMGQPLCCSSANASMWGERLWWWLHALCVTQQYHCASMAAQLSSTGISHHKLFPHLPSICLSTVNSSPHPGIAPQFLNSSSQPLHLPGDLHPCSVYECLWQGLILISFRLPQISCFTLSLKCFSSDSDNCPDMEIWPLLQFPQWPRAGPVLITFLFFPQFLVLLSFEWFYIFFSTRQVLLSSLSCVLHALLCVKVYSWCIPGERYIPCPPTFPPSFPVAI